MAMHDVMNLQGRDRSRIGGLATRNLNLLLRRNARVLWLKLLHLMFIVQAALIPF